MQGRHWECSLECAESKHHKLKACVHGIVHFTHWAAVGDWGGDGSRRSHFRVQSHVAAAIDLRSVHIRSLGELLEHFERMWFFTRSDHVALVDMLENARRKSMIFVAAVAIEDPAIQDSRPLVTVVLSHQDLRRLQGH